MDNDAQRPALLQGTLDLLILSTLDRGPRHGYAIARAIEHSSGGLLAIEEGSLYPALKRLRRAGDIDAEWQTTATGRRGKVYRIVPDGRERLVRERRLWSAYAAAVGRVLSGDAPLPGPFDLASIAD